MSPAVQPVEREVGRRIREARERRGLSLKALAERCGLSLNAISRIERGESSPTVASLHRLASALELPITDFFRPPGSDSTVLVRAGERPRIEGPGLLLESLGSGLPGQRIEPFLMTLQVGAASGPRGVVHTGEEFAFCLEGSVEYHIGQTVYRLEMGDSVLFRADLPHLCRNREPVPARVLFVMRSPEENDRRGHQAHLLDVGETPC